MRWIDFFWEEWKHEIATKHGCTATEMESVIRHVGRGFPRKVGNGRLLVQGRGEGGRMIEVIYFLDEDGAAVVIHGMPLTTRRRRGGK